MLYLRYTIFEQIYIYALYSICKKKTATGKPKCPPKFKTQKNTYTSIINVLVHKLL